MNPASQPPDAADTASHWAARLDAGPLTADEARALGAWLDADPSHEGLLEELQILHGRVRQAVPEAVATGRIPAPARPARARMPGWGWRLAGLAAAVALAGLWLLRAPERIATAPAQRQAIAFADGSLVELNARTALGARIDASIREVRLDRGEAFFAVARDPARPFTVETPAGRVRVTGTAFNVRIDDGGMLDVLVAEGSVEVVPGASGAPLVLKPGDGARYDGTRTEVRHLSATAVDDATAWRHGRIVFDGTPLAEAMARIARHHDRTIEVTPSAGALRLGGRFGLDDLDGFLRDLELALPVRVLRAGDRIRIVAR